MMKASGAAAQAFMAADGRPPRAGQLQRNPDLGKTFRSVAEHGALEGATSRWKTDLPKHWLLPKRQQLAWAMCARG